MERKRTFGWEERRERETKEKKRYNKEMKKNEREKKKSTLKKLKYPKQILILIKTYPKIKSPYSKLRIVS